MNNLTQRIAFVVDALARQQGGAAQIASRSVVLFLAASMALCAGRLSADADAAREIACFGSAPALADQTGRSAS